MASLGLLSLSVAAATARQGWMKMENLAVARVQRDLFWQVRFSLELTFFQRHYTAQKREAQSGEIIYGQMSKFNGTNRERRNPMSRFVEKEGGCFHVCSKFVASFSILKSNCICQQEWERVFFMLIKACVARCLVLRCLQWQSVKDQLERRDARLVKHRFSRFS